MAGLRIGAGHLGGGTRGVRQDAPDKDKDPDGGVLPQPHRVWHEVFEGVPI